MLKNDPAYGERPIGTESITITIARIASVKRRRPAIASAVVADAMPWHLRSRTSWPRWPVRLSVGRQRQR